MVYVNIKTYLPAGLDTNPCIVLNFVLNVVNGLTLRGTEISEESHSEDRSPQYLIDGDLSSDLDRRGSDKQTVEETIEVMSSRAMNQEAEGSHACQTSEVDFGTLLPEELLGK